MLGQDTFDLLIIDWELPDVSGVDVLVWVRKHVDWLIPILFATSRNNESDLVTALDAGADDYLSKPIKQKELLARINALGRRRQDQSKDQKVFNFGIFQVNEECHVIKRLDESVELTLKEYELALFLFRNAGRLVSRSHILESVWGRNPDINTRTVDTHVSRIRQKLGLNVQNGWRLATVYQHGYRLDKIAHL